MKTKRVLTNPNAVDCASPTSVWGYKGCAGKGGKTLNAAITHSDSDGNNKKEEHENED